MAGETEEIAGISIGLSADTTLLKTSLETAKEDVARAVGQMGSHEVEIKAHAVVNDAEIKSARASLRSAIKDLSEQGLKVPVSFDISADKKTIERIQASVVKAGMPVIPAEIAIGNAEAIAIQVKKSLGKAPIEASVKGSWAGWKGDVTPTVAVNVVGHFVDWDEGGGPPQAQGGGNPPRGGRPPRAPTPAPAPVEEPPAKKRAAEQRAAQETGQAVAAATRETPVKVEPSKKEETKVRSEQVQSQPEQARAASTVDEILRATATPPPKPKTRRQPTAPPVQQASEPETEGVLAGAIRFPTSYHEAESMARFEMGESPVLQPPAPKPIEESERYKQGGKDVVECNQCGLVVGRQGWPSHMAKHLRDRKEAEAQQEVEARAAQAQVTLQRRGRGRVDVEPERADEIARFEFDREMGDAAEQAKQQKVWEPIFAAVGAGASGTALHERAVLEPREGHEASLAEFLKTDEGKRLQSLLNQGVSGRKATGDPIGGTAEARAAALEEQGFGLGAALLRSGNLPDVPRNFSAPRGRRNEGVDEAAGERYEMEVRAQEAEAAARLAEVRKNIQGQAFSRRHPDIVTAAQTAAGNMRAALEMPISQKRETVIDEATGEKTHRGDTKEEAAAKDAARAKAIARALGGTEEEPGLYEVSGVLRKTYTHQLMRGGHWSDPNAWVERERARQGARSYRRLTTQRNPREVNSERDAAVLMVKAEIDRLHAEQRATTGHARNVAESTAKARETAESKTEAPATGLLSQGRISVADRIAELEEEIARQQARAEASPALAEQITEREIEPRRGMIARLQETPRQRAARERREQKARAAKNVNAGRKAGAPQIAVQPIDFSEPLESPLSAEERAYSRLADEAVGEPEEKMYDCPCGTSVPMSQMERHMASPEHAAGLMNLSSAGFSKRAQADEIRNTVVAYAQAKQGGPRQYAGGPYNPGVQGATPPGRQPGETGSQYLQRLATGGMPSLPGNEATPPPQPRWLQRNRAKDLTQRGFAGKYNPESKTEGAIPQRTPSYASFEDYLAASQPAIEKGQATEAQVRSIWENALRFQSQPQKAGVLGESKRKKAAPEAAASTDMRVEDLTRKERAWYNRAKKVADAKGVTLTPQDVRNKTATEATPPIEATPEPQIQTSEPAKVIAGAADYMCSACGTTVRDRTAHEKTAKHRRNTASAEPEAAQTAASPLNAEDLANLAANNPKVAAQVESSPELKEAVATGKSARTKGSSSGPTMFCPICNRNVRVAGHESTAQHKNAVAREAQMAAGGGGGGGGMPPAPPGGGDQERNERYVTPAQVRRNVPPLSYQSITRQSERDLVGVRDVTQDVSDFARTILEENPVRALSVAVGQVAVNLVARADLKNVIGDINRNRRDADSLAGDALTAQRDLAAATLAINNPKTPKEEVERLQKAVPDMQQTVKDAEDQFEKVFGAPLSVAQNVAKLSRRDRGRVVRELEKAALAAEPNPEEPETLLGQQGRLRGRRLPLLATTAGVGTLAIVGGTALFTAAMTAFNTAMQYGAEWVGRVTDQMSGFAAEANKTATALGAAALPTGRVQPVIAAQLAQAGIGGAVGARIAGNLVPRVTGEMASQRIEQARDTLALNAQTLQARAQHPGIQNFAGVFQPTGGAVLPLIGQTNIGAQASLQETLAGMLGAQPSNTGFDILTGNSKWARDAFKGVREVFNPQGNRDFEAQQQAATDTLDSLNQFITRGGGTARFINGADLSQDQRSAQSRALLEAGGSPDLANRIHAGDAAIVDAQGNLITSAKGLGAAFDSLAQGMKPSLDQLVQGMRRQLEGQFFSIRQQATRQVEQGNPIQRMVQQATTPIQPFGTGLMTQSPFAMLQAPAASRSAFMGLMPQADAITNEIRDNAAKGWEEFTKMARSSPVVDNPEQLIGDMQRVRDLGQDLADRQAALASQNVGLQWDEYNTQVMRARRNIGDLAGMVKNNNGVEATHLGILNAENLAYDRQLTRLGRRSQALSLEMNQRQINFQRALAGFQAPGQTPGEAAAQARQGEIEADYAQQQQDIAQEQFGIQGKQINNSIQIVDEQNLRAFQDALKDFQLFQDNFKLQKQSEALSDYAARVQQLQSNILQDVQTEIGAMQSAASAQDQVTADIFQQGSDTLTKTAKAVDEAFREVGKNFREHMDLPPLPPRAGILQEPQTETPQSGIGGRAIGFVGSINTPTSMTVGEAGSEQVAIIRNPRTVLTTPTGGNGSSMSINININNPIVREETDIQSIVQAVERSLNRSASLFLRR